MTMTRSRDDGLAALLGRFRAGDPDAAVELVRVYEPPLRRMIRLRIRDSRLRRLYDSTDICQSVLASFFARLSLGQFDLENPQQLVRLLEVMARNAVATQARKAQVTRRDEREIGGPGALAEPTAPGPSFTEQVASRELVSLVRGRMNEEERRISDLRGSGLEWAQVAVQVGGTPEAVRKRMERAFDRITRDLGWEE